MIDTYEVWSESDNEDYSKVWGGDDPIIAVQAFNNQIAQGLFKVDLFYTREAR